MLEHIGCTASSSQNSAVTADELVRREHSALVDFTVRRAVFRFMRGHIARVSRVAARRLALARVMAGGRGRHPGAGAGGHTGGDRRATHRKT